MDADAFAKKVARRSRPTSRLVLISHREQIERCLVLGYTMREIFSVMVDEGIYQFDYTTFTRGIKKYVLNTEKQETLSPRLTPTVSPGKGDSGIAQKNTGPTISEVGSAGFVFKAKADPKDLV